MGERYDQLTLDERKLIFQLREAKMSVPRVPQPRGPPPTATKTP